MKDSQSCEFSAKSRFCVKMQKKLLAMLAQAMFVACFALVRWEKVGDALDFFLPVGDRALVAHGHVELFARATP